MSEKNKFSLSSKSLNYKLRIIFYLVLILPLLIFIYLISSYSLPHKELDPDAFLLIAIGISIWVGGFWVIRDVIRRIVEISSEAKMIAAGDVERLIYQPETDEVGDLGEAINMLTQQIRSNMEELKDYSQKTTEVNLQIQRRVIVLSSLLQISAMVSEGNKLDDILVLAVEKSRHIVNSNFAYLLLKDEKQEALQMKVADGKDVNYLSNMRLDIQGSIFENCIRRHSILVVDSGNPLPHKMEEGFYKKFRFNNTLALPLYSRGRLLGVLGIGSVRENFKYAKDDIDLLDVFAKNITMAIESDRLKHRVEKLEIKDALTGIFNESFIRSRLQEEIKRSLAYQRPCALILLKISNYSKLCERFGNRFAEATLKKIAVVINDSISEVDRVARFGDDTFAVLLPEKNKRRAIEVAEEIKEKIDFSFSEEEPVRRVVISGGLSENPLDGINADELIQKAQELLVKASATGKGLIIC